MDQYKIEVRAISVPEYQALRNTTNWGDFNDNLVERALQNDLFSVCITDNGEAIGMGRVIGDGAIYFYIQDVIVKPEYHGHGVGKLIMESIESYIQGNANQNSFIGLMAAEDVQGFYRNYGYEVRPDNRPGMYKVIK